MMTIIIIVVICCFYMLLYFQVQDLEENLSLLPQWFPQRYLLSVLPSFSSLHSLLLGGEDPPSFPLTFSTMCNSRQSSKHKQDIYLVEMMMGAMMAIASTTSTLIALKFLCNDASSTDPSVHISHRLHHLPPRKCCGHLQIFTDSFQQLQTQRMYHHNNFHCQPKCLTPMTHPIECHL